MADKSAERSSIEIKDLLRKLHPERGNHKDRIRRLNKFRNYIMPNNAGVTPEFFDDDIPLLYLGAHTPAIFIDDEADLPMGLFYGLLPACGMRSAGEGLKRSCRQAMGLLRWMLMEWREANQASDFNIFARSFLSLPVASYRHMELNLHVTDDERGGAKEDACHIIVFILCSHMAEDQETPQPVLVEELVTTPQAQQAYDLWSARASLTAQQQERIKKNTLTRQGEIALQQRQEALVNKAAGVGAGGAGDDLDLLLDDSDHPHNDGSEGHDDGNVDDHDPNESDEDSDHDELDVMAAIRKRQKTIRKELKAAEVRGDITAAKGVHATKWEDSQLAREQAMREAVSSKEAGKNDSSAAAVSSLLNVRDPQNQLAQEAALREEEKGRLHGKDPLGIISPGEEEVADLRQLEQSQAEQMEKALYEIQEEIQKAESAGTEDQMKKAIYQKESLEQLVEKLGGLEAMENNPKASILPTNSRFNSLLFLTLLHRKTNYKELMKSMERLSSKTENQAEQLQNLVRDNFPLFVRCAEGFEEFRRNSETEVGLGVNERIEKLQGIAESAAFQAKTSFKPLLDNTSEMRKVQSALSVLNRVAPILQVPALMRQHIENRRYSQALKAYRRSLVVDDSCNISLLNHVKMEAEDCVRVARRDLEKRLTEEKVPIDDLLVGIRDLGELLELDVPNLDTKKMPDRTKGGSRVDWASRRSNGSLIGTAADGAAATAGADNKDGQREAENTQQKQENLEDQGIYEVDGTVVNIRDHPPALACLLLQSAHFSRATKMMIASAEETAKRIFAGESLSSVQTDIDEDNKKADYCDENDSDAMPPSPKSTRGSGNQWKYDVLDARVLSTIKSVDIARSWLPRLVRVGKAAREEEKRRDARIGHRFRISTNSSSAKESQLSAFEVFVVNVSPALLRLVEHASFCSLGSNTRTGAKVVEMSFGQNCDDKLRTLLRSPLPPSQSTKVGKELASLVELLIECSGEVDALRPQNALLMLSPLDSSKSLGDSAVVTIEKRRCIYAFDVCSRACSNRASGSGKFDADALLNCLQNLSEQLTRPEECSNEVEKGCELVIRRCCEGLASYVRDRGDDARLSAVSECADVMAERIDEVIQEASSLTPRSEAVREVVMEDIMGLESAMFDEYLENIRHHVANSVRVGWLDKDSADAALGGDANLPPSFPSYLSASLLAIVRCRAQVEQALGDRVRKSEGVSYQHLSMATVADGVVEGICSETVKRKMKLKVRQADRLANELEFLNNTLKKFLGDDTLELLDSTLQMVSAKAGRGRDYQGDGPDGLAALEELERLGRVYVLCLGD